MEALVNEYSVKVFERNDDIAKLAKIYVDSGIIPSGYRTDALHIAAATFYGMDFIVSLNFRHIVRHKTIALINPANALAGYTNQLFIHTPMEIVENG